MFNLLRSTSSVLFVLLSLQLSGSASAALLNIDDGGNLLGAYNVLVRGTAYDVEFVDGTAKDLFSEKGIYTGTFSDGGLAFYASKALLDQVLIDTAEGNFDTEPDLIHGITGPGRNTSTIITPYYRSGYNITTSITASVANNHTAENNDRTRIHNAYGVNWDTALEAGAVYAKWTKSANTVPIPSSITLLGFGLVYFAGIRRRDPEV